MCERIIKERRDRGAKGEMEQGQRMGRLQGLCASHMNSKGRWKRFEQMLASWEAQRHKIPLTISMLFDVEVQREVEIPARERLRILVQERKLLHF